MEVPGGTQCRRGHCGPLHLEMTKLASQGREAVGGPIVALAQVLARLVSRIKYEAVLLVSLSLTVAKTPLKEGEGYLGVTVRGSLAQLCRKGLVDWPCVWL